MFSYALQVARKLWKDGNGELSAECEGSTIWAASSSAAGANVITLTAFTLATVEFPVQIKAQEESNHVVGTNSLPSFPDRENLPCVAAMVKDDVADLANRLPTHNHRRTRT